RHGGSFVVWWGESVWRHCRKPVAAPSCGWDNSRNARASRHPPPTKGRPAVCRPAFLALIVSLALAASGGAQTREQKVRADRKKVEAEGGWIYNDLARAFAEAKRTARPMLVVLRCIPCHECVKLDDDLVNQDRRVRPLLEKFVCVRVISTNGLDLS